MLRAGAAMCLLAGAFAAGCGGSRPAPRVFALADVYYPRGDFEGAALVRVNPRTLQPLRGSMLRLGDGVTSRVRSPDGHTLAFGGYNFGEIIFIDLAHPTRVRRLTPVRRSNGYTGVDVEVEAWPSRSRLIAVATVAGPWWAANPSSVLVIDPARGRVVRRTPLHGGAWPSVSVADGTTALLVNRGRIPRVVVVEPNGSTWSVRLSRIDLLGGKRVRVGGTSFAPTRVAGIASDGHSRVFVVAADRPIAEIDLSRHELRYHTVALPHRYLTYPPPMEPGSGGVHLTFFTSATWLGDDQLGVGGYDELPALIRGFGAGHRDAERVLQVVDTRSWRLARVVRASDCAQTHNLTLCHPGQGGLVAYDQHWRRLYVKASRELWWGVTEGRLFAGAPDGSRISELAPATGHVLRKIRPSPLSNQIFPPDLLTWGEKR
jgi:hypothetical protein